MRALRATRLLDVRVLWGRLSERAGKTEGIRGLLCGGSGWLVGGSCKLQAKLSRAAVQSLLMFCNMAFENTDC
jgi:hypothetical protein